MKTNPNERSVSKEIKKELCSSGHPLRMRIKVKDEANLSKNSLEIKAGHHLPSVSNNFMKKGSILTK